MTALPPSPACSTWVFRLSWWRPPSPPSSPSGWCAACATAASRCATGGSPQQLAALGTVDGIDSMFIPTGCEVCDHTGYHGRVGVYELLSFDDFVRGMRSGKTSDIIRGVLRDMGITDAGKRPRQDPAGISLEEVARVVPVQLFSLSWCPACRHQVVPSFRFCPHGGAAETDGGGKGRRSPAKSARKSSEKRQPLIVMKTRPGRAVTQREAGKRVSFNYFELAAGSVGSAGISGWFPGPEKRYNGALRSLEPRRHLVENGKSCSTH